MLINTTLSVPLSKQSLLWFHQSKLSLFRPFLFSSKLDHITCSDLLLVIEARRYESTSFSLLKDRSRLAEHCHHQHYLQSNWKNVRKTSDATIFKVVRLETSILQSRIFSSHCLPSTSQLCTAPKLSHLDFSFSQSVPFHQALDSEQKAKSDKKS